MPLVHPRKPQKSSRLFRRLVIPIILLVSMGAGLWYMMKPNTPQTSVVERLNETPAPAPNQSTTTELKNFSGAEFVDLYNAFAYPNVREFEIVPEITGDVAADNRIRELALSRGYKARSIAIPPLTDADEYQLQERAARAWKELTDAARSDGHRLTMTAGFRTIADQQALFMNALNATGATKTSIAASKSDNAVIGVLRTIAIPGYTRHHSGYTVDIGCASQPNVAFGASGCFRWLSGDNYKNAKSYGWIPSYPEGAPDQGPEPEAWEYSWVGLESVSETVTQ